MPVLAVELLAIGLKVRPHPLAPCFVEPLVPAIDSGAACGVGRQWQYTHEDIIAMKPPPIDKNALIEQSPYREIYFAVRAILPLNIALVALVVLGRALLACALKRATAAGLCFRHSQLCSCSIPYCCVITAPMQAWHAYACAIRQYCGSRCQSLHTTSRGSSPSRRWRGVLRPCPP
jgi:hypothetical protein